jgi:exonuclease SbcD
MFRFIHAADIHLDSPLRGLSRYETAPAEAIRGACRRAFENLVELAIEEKVSFVLLAGDLYDGDWKDYNTGIFLSRQMGILNDHRIQVYVVAGNHDAESKLTKALENPSNMTILSSRSPQSIRLDDLPVVVHGQSFAQQHIDTNLASQFPRGLRGMFNIGLLHTSLDGREGHAVYAPCSLDDLCSKGYQYWALGHIHKQEFVSKDPWIVFPGCVQGRHIRENGAKGCALVTVDDNSVSSVEMRSLDVFRWASTVVNLNDVNEIREVLDKVRHTITQETNISEDRPVAIRIRFEGASSLSDMLAAYPDRFEQQIRALGAEIIGEDLWIEKVEVATTGKLDLETALSNNNSLGTLLKEILSLSETPGNVDGLSNIIADLRQKAPPEAFGSGTGLDLDNPESVARIVREAKQLLVGRLLEQEGK